MEKTEKRYYFEVNKPENKKIGDIQLIWLPGNTSSDGSINDNEPSAFSAERIIPSDIMPRNFLGSRLAIKQTCFPTSWSGWG